MLSHNASFVFMSLLVKQVNGSSFLSWRNHDLNGGHRNSCLRYFIVGSKQTIISIWLEMLPVWFCSFLIIVLLSGTMWMVLLYKLLVFPFGRWFTSFLNRLNRPPEFVFQTVHVHVGAIRTNSISFGEKKNIRAQWALAYGEKPGPKSFQRPFKDGHYWRSIIMGHIKCVAHSLQSRRPTAALRTTLTSVVELYIPLTRRAYYTYGSVWIFMFGMCLGDRKGPKKIFATEPITIMLSCWQWLYKK